MMNLKTLNRNIKRQIIDAFSWHTKRRIVVIESDDWGSIRMPSKEIYDRLLKKGVRVDQCPYTKYDSLANEEDLTFLFETLSSVKDINGNFAKITANSIVANPDFEKIRAHNFDSYHYETFIDTLKSYPKHSNSFALWKEGMLQEVFYPQFHGREHVNIDFWLEGLKNKLPETTLAFENRLFGISSSITTEVRGNYMFALDFNSKTQEENKSIILEDGLRLFEQIFGYKSKSFIAPAYTWSDLNEHTLSECEIQILQGNPYQNKPTLGRSRYKRVLHYTGEKNSLGQIYLVRNAYFEPSILKRETAVNECLKRINFAFYLNRPAIISAHRVNFIGNIDNKNRDHNLKLLSQLLTRIKKRWPNVEFMTSDKLGELILGKHV